MKKALMVVSFGTSYPTALEKSIGAMERELAAAFPDRDLFRAFTSRMIRRKLLRRDRLKIDGVVESLEALRVDGYQDILIQPTHMINGEEMQGLMTEATLYAMQFPRFHVGKPILTGQRDYEELATAIMREVPELRFDEALVLMGHGTAHYANSAYAAMEYVFHAMGYHNVFVGTVEGYPTVEDVIRRLDETLNARRVYLAPMMAVAGEHAWKDMVGEEPESWKNQLAAHHYQPIPLMRGLGEYSGVRQILVRHAREALGKA